MRRHNKNWIISCVLLLMFNVVLLAERTNEVVSENAGSVIGRSGTMAKAIRTLVNACAYKNNIKKLRVNIDSI